VCRKKKRKESYDQSKGTVQYEDLLSRSRDWKFRNRYGITLAEYNDLVESQDGKCHLCGNPPDYRGLCVDHDHYSGEVRKLLCRSCNWGLGKFKDDPKLLMKAAQYILDHQIGGY
jgi:hypothetical protein